ncbi:phosphatidylglycerol lysyltransferase domain-containing protein [Pseudogemmobacter sp. W21_MBD1_M6]|uniref:phosphatidylglycerol lysyltransferase domain-containing protein n=1 Tax=Pseudogemmobacter sp. W21_MBD1_M6 TaxID=3240271 RepID=UPI003F9677DF
MRHENPTKQTTATMQLSTMAWRQGGPLLLAGVCLYLFAGRLAEVDLALVWPAFRTVQPVQWAAAGAATLVSFWAVGRYDAVIHRHLATLTPPDQARHAGIVGIALAQTLGFGVLTGTLVRWRMLPQAQLLQAARIAFAVAVSFMAGLCVVTGAVVLITGAGPAWMSAVAILPLAALFGLCALSLRGRALTLAGRKIRLPSLLTVLAVVSLTALDTVAACAALYAVMPADLTLGFMTLLPVYLIALGVALFSGSPGGVGPFEVMVLFLCPGTPTAPLLAAILAFRLVYYAIPAGIAAIAMIVGPVVALRAASPRLTVPTPLCLEQLTRDAPRAEAGLLRMGDKSVLEMPGNTGQQMVAVTGQALIAIGDPLFRQTCCGVLHGLEEAADARGLRPAVYKCGARMAVAARRRRYRVHATAREAWLPPAQFDPASPATRQLRRKLRQAEHAGVTVTRATGPLPLPQMAQVARDWTLHHGAERGFSMGRFSPDYMAGQIIYLGWVRGCLAGFVTFHANPQERTLDLMRHTPGAPDGLMHALVTHALLDAAADACPRVSLAAVPLMPRWVRDLPKPMTERLDRICGGNGLRQFKGAFAPHWETLYTAAPTRLDLCLAGFDVARAILNPEPLPLGPLECEPSSTPL